MAYRFFTLLLWVSLTISFSKLAAQSFGIYTDTAVIQANQQVCLSIKSKNYTELMIMQLFFSWDNQILKFKKTSNYNLAGLSGTDINPIPDHGLALAWASPTGTCIVADSGRVLFDICFTAIGPPNSIAYLRLDTGQVSICLNPYTVIIGDDTIGVVTVTNTSSASDVYGNEAISFRLFPNPALSSTQLMFKSPDSDWVILLVTDVLGRTVFEQKIAAKPGENRLEIPVDALAAKGMYQVSLQTKNGVSSQMLSVH